MTEKQTIVEKIYSLLNSELFYASPVLSGNMRSSIRTGLITPDEKEVVIEAMFYDMDYWRKTGAIVHTGEVKDGFTDYAYWVNKLGGFATHNRSEHWVNRCIYESVQAIAAEMGAIVKNELPL